jgi:hypothetical protein
MTWMTIISTHINVYLAAILCDLPSCALAWSMNFPCM